MKKLFTLLIITASTLNLLAQPPKGMSFQCVVRNTSGALVVNQTVGMRTTILWGTSLYVIVYAETYNPEPKTNANGVLTVIIGSGIPSTGTFSSINWQNGPFSVKTEIDPTGGTNYTIVGQSQILSVPYALYAERTGPITETDPVWTGVSSNYYNRTNLQTSGGAKIHFGNLTERPETLAGYGINDAVDITGNQTITGIKTFSNDLTVNGLTVGKGNDPTMNNIVVGINALNSNTTGNNSTAIGVDALYSNTTGKYNTAIGIFPLRSNTTGLDNTAIGNLALGTNTEGWRNTAYGNETLYNNRTGNRNTAIGAYALGSNHSGNRNTAIGAEADVALSPVITNATVIGCSAIVDASNKVRIGNSDVTVIEGQVNWSVGSDIRLKENIGYSDELGLEFINGLKTATFK
jgi:hypothetical protein